MIAPSDSSTAGARSERREELTAAVSGPVAGSPDGLAVAPAMDLDARLIALGVPAEILAEVRGLARANGAGMVDLLLQKKVLPEPELLTALGEEYGIPFWEALPTDHIDTGFTALFSIQYLKKQKMVPLDTPQGFVVAVNDPANFQAADDLCRLLGLPERPVVLATQEAIQAAINLAYDLSRSTAKEFFQEMNDGVDGQPHLRDRGDRRPPGRDERRPDHQAGQPPPLRGDRRTGRATSTSSPTRATSRSATGSTASSTTS